MANERERSSAQLNAMRSIAALAVMAGHLRSEFWVGHKDIVDGSVWVSVIYAVTDFANDAVCVFFVLSGYFIGTSVLRDLRSNRFSWRRYLVARWSRLAVVLYPALILTFVWDSLGLELTGADVKYSGFDALASFEEFPPYPERSSVLVLLGNGLFLQCLFVPAYGSNSALWSLSYEWWYYLLGPVVLIGVVRSVSYSLNRLVLAIVLVTIVACVNLKMVLCFPLWLLGCAVSAIPRIERWRVEFTWRWTIGCFSGFLSFLVLMHLPSAKVCLEPYPVLRNSCVAIGFSLLLYVVLHNSAANTRDWFDYVSRSTSEFSYSLYLLHLPLIVCLSPGENVQPSLGGVFEMACVGLVVFVYAWFISRLTEAHTDSFRQWMTYHCDWGCRL